MINIFRPRPKPTNLDSLTDRLIASTDAMLNQKD